jgi:hypothetical protein
MSNLSRVIARRVCVQGTTSPALCGWPVARKDVLGSMSKVRPCEILAVMPFWVSWWWTDVHVVPVAPRGAVLHDQNLHGLAKAAKDDLEPPQNLRQAPGAIWSDDGNETSDRIVCWASR